jgi:hypothetical protein
MKITILRIVHFDLDTLQVMTYRLRDVRSISLNPPPGP